MKSARFKNLTRTIKGTLNRFFAIAAIVALGAGFLGGLMATSPDMKDAADSYMDKYNWYDLDVVNYLGFNHNEIEEIKKIEGVKDTQKAIVEDYVFLNSEKKRLTVRVFGLLSGGETCATDGESLCAVPDMNGFEVKKGRMPLRSDECIVQVASMLSASVPSVGEVLEVASGKGKNCKFQRLTVVGIAQGPMYFTAEMEASGAGSGYLDYAVYVRPDFFVLPNFNHLFVTIEGAKELDTWSKEYKTLVENVKSQIENQIGPKVEHRFDSLLEYPSQINKINATVNLVDSKLLQSHWNDLQATDQVISVLQENSADSVLLQALKQDRQLNSVKRKPANLNLNQESFIQIAQKVQPLKSRVFSVATRSQSTGYSSYKDNIEKIESLSKVFPAFFFFIAMLVSLTTMTRLVEEKRTEIGTLKSLGFSNVQLLGQYLLYAFLSSFLGCVVGLTIGFKIFPAAVTLSYSMMYTVPLGKLPFRWGIACSVSLIAISVIMISTLFACFKETVSRPAVLMAPKAPKAGKRILLERIGFIWNKLNFSKKVAIRNMFRYKGRLWMTIAGIAGCSALLVAGLGLRDSLQDIITIQFRDIDKYNVSVLLSDSNSFEDKTISDFLNDEKIVKDWIKIHGETISVSNGEKSMPLTLYVPEKTDNFYNFINLRTRKGHKKIDLNQEGIVINEKQTELLGVKTGDFITLKDNSGFEKQIKIIGQSENYAFSNAYMNQTYYENLFSKKPDFNAVLCQLYPEFNNKETMETLMESPNVMYALWVDNLLKNAHKTIASIDVVVFVIIITSGILSFIVLYNLTNINICERKREIATLLVLGYTEKEAERYIFREINVLSLIGTIIGLFLGAPLHSIVVHATEVSAVMWGRTVHPLSFVIAFMISMIFTFGINLLMKKSIKNINMVESLKSFND